MPLMLHKICSKKCSCSYPFNYIRHFDFDSFFLNLKLENIDHGYLLATIIHCIMLKIIAHIKISYFMFTAINRFRCSFLIPGGLHEPKKLDCVCSDGVLRSLLLKVKYLYIYIYICLTMYTHFL